MKTIFIERGHTSAAVTAAKSVSGEGGYHELRDSFRGEGDPRLWAVREVTMVTAPEEAIEAFLQAMYHMGAKRFRLG